MKNRIVSLFQLDELLAPPVNGHASAARKRIGHSRTDAPAAAVGAPARKQKSCRKGKAPSMSQGFDAGAPIHCQHTVPYPAVQPVELPAPIDATPSRASALGIEVEAFEGDEDLLDALPPLSTDVEQESVREMSAPDEDEAPAPDENRDTADWDDRSLPQSFAAQMQAVESDLAELAERADHPAPNAPSDGYTEQDRPVATSAGTPSASRNHGVFDAMAKGMSYATEFRLPSVQLSQVFSALDRQLDAVEVPAVPVAPTNATPTGDAVVSPYIPRGDVLLADLARLTRGGGSSGPVQSAPEAPRADA